MRLTPRGTGYTAIGLGAVLVLGGISIAHHHPGTTPPPAPSPAATYADGAEPPLPSQYTRIVTAAADSTVDSAAPETNLGNAATLRISTEPARFAYLRFDVSGLTAPPARAMLWLHATAGSAPPRPGGLVASMSADTWVEAAVSYDTRPGISGPLWDQLGLVDPDNWYAVDVTPAVTGDGSVALALSPDSGSTVEYDAREKAEYAPRLELSTAPADPVLLAVGDCGTATAALLRQLAGPIVALRGQACVDATLRARYRPAVTRPAGTKPAWSSANLGSWHIVVLSADCGHVGGCGAGSPELTWLRADLVANRARCILAYWPAQVSATSADLSALVEALHAAGAAVVLRGGIGDLLPGHGAAPGVLRLSLHPGGYEWRFVPVAGQTLLGSGTGRC